MQVSVGTFNLNNLFSRFNFGAAIGALPPHEAGGIELTFSPDDITVRTFKGRLVKAKDPDDTSEIARRIREIDVDVLAVQEVEHIEILRRFNRENLNGLYAHAALIEGNDSRMIDVGFLSKLPLGPIVSYQTATHPEVPGRRVFSRDLVSIEVMNAAGTQKLFTLYNTHLKSHFVPHDEDPVQGAIDANRRRRRQAEMVSTILSARERVGGRFILTGDMNDPPDSDDLAPMLTVDGQPLVDALDDAVETRPPKPETPGQGPGPARPQWTHRFNPDGPPPPEYELYDQIWLSPALAATKVSAHIDRRTKHTGDGSDHDPAWVVLDL